jgi:hypothetical protein
MGATRNQYFNLGLAVAVGLIISGRSTAADSKMRSEIAVHVYNYARVNQETLAEAEKVAARIFVKAGVETQWVEVDSSPRPKSATRDERACFALSYIQLDILTREMFDRLGPADSVMGLALGAGPNRKYVYVSYNRADALFLEESEARGRGISRPLASKGQILGHVFAHEMGHILLNTANHSPSGIMRGVWDVNTWSDAFSGKMLFSAEQAQILRAQVLRRTAQEEEQLRWKAMRATSFVSPN